MASVAKRRWTYKGIEKEAWIVRYKDQAGVHRNKTFAAKKTAEAYRLKVENELQAGTHIAASQILTVAQVAREFLQLQEDRVRDGRIGRQMGLHYHVTMNNHVIPLLGAIRITEVRPEHATEFYRHLVRGGRMSPRTARSRVDILKQLFDFAVKRRFVHQNPVIEARVELRGIVSKPIRTFTLDELKAVLTAAEIRRYKSRERARQITACAVHLAAFCGLRYGEIMGLTVENVDMARRVIRVRHSLTRWDELKGPKTRAGVRDVPLPTHLADMLARYVATYYRDNPRGLIFRTRSGAILATNSFHFAYWGPLLDQAGVSHKPERLHFHALRHFAASWMIENGWSLPDVAGVLGHSKFDTTLQVYAHSIHGGTHRLEAMQSMTDRLVSADGATVARAALPPPRIAQELRKAA